MTERDDRRQHQSVLDWARDRDYMVLACIPYGDRPGYLPSYGMLIQREYNSGTQYVVWTAVIAENGDVSVCWGHYHFSLADAMESLNMKVCNQYPKETA